MKVVVTIAAVNPKHGGPPRTVPALCSALAQTGVEVELITVGEELGMVPEIAENKFVKVTSVATVATRYHPFAWRQAFCAAISNALDNRSSVIMYDVGVWLPSNHFAANVARSSGAPLVSSPRGMLSIRALESAKWKKKVAWRVYQKRDLMRARVLHASSEEEAVDFRRLGLRQPIAVVSNGTEIPPEVGRRGEEKKMRTVLFLSRLHPIKGLSDLVNAWALVRPRNWRAVVAGPDESSHRRKIEALVRHHGLESDFEFLGPVDDALKWDLMAGSDLFVLPSYSESFGLAIAEALASGLPVITTRATPWGEIEGSRSGWWVEPGVDSLTEAFRQATSRSCGELVEMGQRGRQLVTERYSWDTVAGKMMSLFRWIVEGGDRPDFVR